ncbi:MAG: DUF2092 domain-containing protein [Planctomycetota bacterium]
MLCRRLMLQTLLMLFLSPTLVFGQGADVLASDGKPLPSGIAYPQWCLNQFEAKANYGTDADIVEHVEIEMVASPENAAKARAVLDNMTAFLSKQDSCSFSLDYELNSQTTMGVIESEREAGKYCDSYDFKFAKPNLLRVSDRKKRDDKYHWEIGSDGTYVLRTDFDTTTIELAAADFRELLEQDSLARGWAYSVDARGILSMFDPESFKKQNKGRRAYYVGETNFGSIKADRLFIQLTEEEAKVTYYKRMHLFVAQGAYPVPLMIVRDCDRLISIYTNSEASIKADRYTRELDTEWKFMNWKFNTEFPRKDFQLSMPSQPLVTRSESQEYRRKEYLPAFVDSPLAKFSAIDVDGKEFSSEELLDGKPTVLLLWNDVKVLSVQWKGIDEALAKFESDQVQAYAIYIGLNRNEAETRKMLRGLLEAEALEEAGYAGEANLLFIKDNRYLMQPEIGVMSSWVAVTDANRKVVDVNLGYQYPSNNVRDVAQVVEDNVTALLEGRDVVAEKREQIAEIIAAREQTRKYWDRKFLTSWQD